MTDGKTLNSTLLDEILRCETAVWRALQAGDKEADAAALDQRFVGVYPDGFAGKEEHVGQLADGPTIRTFELSDCRLQQLGQDHAVISYKANFTRTSRKKPESMYVSSIWKRTKSGWINIFSQDTPAAE